MTTIEELTEQSREDILADIMDMRRSVTAEQYIARTRIAELKAALQKIVELDSNPDEPVPYSWGLIYFHRAHSIAKAALVSDDRRSSECA